MNAEQVFIHGVGDTRLEAVTVPDEPGAGEVLIETECSFISAGTELSAYIGTRPAVSWDGAVAKYPSAPGYANAGRVIATGSAVEGIIPGDRVFSFGRHTSHHLQAQDGGNHAMLLAVPEGIPAEEAALCRMACVAFTALQTSDVQLNDRVAIFGLGVVGNIAAQLFQLAGARVIGIDPVAGRQKAARAAGIEHVLGETGDALADAITAVAGDPRVEITVDAVGSPQVVETAARHTATFGQVVLLGNPRGSYETDIGPQMLDLQFRWLNYRSALEWLIPARPIRGTRNSLQGNLETTFDLILAGKLNLQPLISHRLSPDDIDSAYDGLANDKEHYFGVILDWCRPGN